MQGYKNRILRVDLTDRQQTIEPLRMDWAKKYIGAKGLGIRYMYEEVAPGIDPLSPENKLLLMTGPMTGTTVPCSGKLAVISKSPATGTILDCSIGGHCGITLRYAGYDGVIFEGKLDQPGYLIIDDDTLSFEDAGWLWGKSAHEAEKMLAEKHGHSYHILIIGPAGENLLGIACINSDYYRQAGRGGIGAVMGSKNLKAILIRGTGGVEIPDIKNAVKRLQEILYTEVQNEDNLWAWESGTVNLIEACNDGGILPYKNFSDTTDPNWENYNAEVMARNRKGKRGCGSCGLGCGNFVKIGNAVCEGPEYEGIAGSGPNCGVSDPEAIVKFNEVCDDMGMDVISASVIISYAMEMTEKGAHDFGIRFGDKEKYVEYLKLMGRQEGVGKELGLGVMKLSERYGGSDIAMHSKGLEFPMYDPRGSWATSVAYAVSDRGACHMRAYPPSEEVYAASMPPYSDEGKGQLVYDLTIYNGVKFAIPICDFWPLSLERMAELMQIVTGESYTEEDMVEIARNVTNIARAFNQREGFNKKDDIVPKRIFNEALKSGPAAGQKIPESSFEKMLQEYYALLGWNENGMIPQDVMQML